MSRYARAGRCPPGTRRAVRTRGVVRDGCVVVNQAAAEFQQLTGHPHLGGTYGLGQGVPEDPIQAHKWLNLAASRMSGERFEEIKKTRDLLADEMSVDQLNTARRLAAEWRPSTWAEVQKTR